MGTRAGAAEDPPLRLMCRTLQEHWPEYLIEAWGLGTFMVSASVFATLLFALESPVPRLLPSDAVRLVLMGIAMGVTVLGIVVSPWGRRSGAHINPAFTITFWRLGKVAHWDAVLYIGAQFVGGLAGVLLMIPVLGRPFTQAPVRYVVTVPGPDGVAAAFVGELLIAMVTMAVVLTLGSRPRLAPWTPYAVAVLVASWVTFESPYSGFGMNPARTVASALPADDWSAVWLYIVSPLAGMLAAAQVFLWTGGFASTELRGLCAKIYHDASFVCAHARAEDRPPRCIFSGIVSETRGHDIRAQPGGGERRERAKGPPSRRPPARPARCRKRRTASHRRGRRLRRPRGGQGAEERARPHPADRPAQSSRLPAPALPGGDGDAAVRRHRRPDPRGLAEAETTPRSPWPR